MSQETSKLDNPARFLYELFRDPEKDKGWTKPWAQLSRKDRDYWRARAQLYVEDGHWKE